MKKRQPTIFILCTEAYSSSINTGIQRVTKNILTYADEVAGKMGYKIQPIIFEKGRLKPISLEKVLSQHKNDYRKKTFTEVVKRIKYKYFLSLDKYKTQKNNILFIPEIYLYQSNLWSTIIDFKLKSGSIQSIVYDLIPINQPETVGFEPWHFKEWLDNLVKYSSQILTISKFVKDDLNNYLSINQVNRRPLVNYFYLGSNLNLNTKYEKNPPISKFFKKDCPTFVVVGSIEPRKNHRYVIEAMDIFWQQKGQASLIIIGKEGWKNEKIIQVIKNHPEYNNRLFLLRNASDDDLNFAYENSTGLIFASTVEGFGLPIIEAFQYGLPVFCSNIPVFKEIADNKAIFFDINSSRDLSDKLVKYCQEPLKNRQPVSWLTGRESVEMLFEIIISNAKINTPINNYGQTELINDKNDYLKEKNLSYSVDELLIQNNWLIENIYLKVLKRQPDIMGLNFYSDQLESNKMQPIEILGRIRYSSEGIKNKVEIKGLKYKLLIYFIDKYFPQLFSRLKKNETNTEDIYQLFKEVMSYYCTSSLSGINNYSDLLSERLKYYLSINSNQTKIFISILKNILKNKPIIEKEIIQTSRDHSLKILYISGVLPTIVHGGGLRLIDIISELSKKHEVDLFTICRTEQEKDLIDQIGKSVKNVGLAQSISMEKLERWLKGIGKDKNNYYDIIQLEYINTANLVCGAKKYGKKVGYTFMECLTKKSAIDIKNDLQKNTDPTNSIINFINHASAENYISQKADFTIALTPEDKDFVTKFNGNIPSVVTTGISPIIKNEQTGENKIRYSVAFVGYFNHRPNTEGMLWYFEKIHHIVKNKIPDYKIAIVGYGDTTELKKINPNDGSVIFTGFVDNISEYINSAKICISPLISGAGMRGKINQYSILGKPCVSTDIGLEGTPYVHQESVLKADDPQRFAEYIIELLTNNQLYEKISKNCRKVADDNFDWEKSIEKLESIYYS